VASDHALSVRRMDGHAQFHRRHAGAPPEADPPRDEKSLAPRLLISLLASACAARPSLSLYWTPQSGAAQHSR